MPLDDLCKSPLPIKIADTHYEVSPLTMADMGELCRIIQFQEYSNLAQVKGVSEDYLKDIFRECTKKKVVFQSPEYLEGMNTAEGQTGMAWLSLRHKNPDLKLETVQNMKSKDVGVICEACLYLTNPFDDYPKTDDKGKEVLDDDGNKVMEPGAIKNLHKLKATHTSLFC
jgi:hypothetical protein